ncbi:HPr kinase/phosphorylase [soil metagenome]
MQPIHATTVACRVGDAQTGGGRASAWVGVLLTGPSGSGKSDLALRLIGEGWRLVADDYTQVWASGGALWGAAPARIAGLIEARSLGIVPAPLTRSLARLGLVIACQQKTAERAPEPETRTIAGHALPLFTLDTRPTTATALVRLALEGATGL